MLSGTRPVELTNRMTLYIPSNEESLIFQGIVLHIMDGHFSNSQGHFGFCLLSRPILVLSLPWTMRSDCWLDVAHGKANKRLGNSNLPLSTENTF